MARYYNCRTSRNPTRALVTSTPPGARHADRVCAGALAQEAIDVVAVLNALRVAWHPGDLTDYR